MKVLLLLVIFHNMNFNNNSQKFVEFYKFESTHVSLLKNTLNFSLEQKSGFNESQIQPVEKVIFLERLLLIISLFFGLLILYLYFDYKRNKLKKSKEINNKKIELEINLESEVISQKNKELAATALTILDKEEITYEFKDFLEKSKWAISPQKLKDFIVSFDDVHIQSWKDFENRFIESNTDFFDNLHSKHPNLTSNDDKLCSLIKLDLSTIDMARVMKISPESVHTSRYRLRKKLGLEREDNLTEFISKF